MKTKILIIVGITLLISLFIAMQMNVYVKRTYFDDLDALWTGEETLIFVQVNTNYEKMPRWKILLAKCFRVPFLPNDDNTQTELNVFHAADGNVDQSQQKNFNIGGQFACFEGTLYLIQGGYSISGFKWEGNHFVEIDSKSLRQVESALKSGDNLQTCGWHILDWEQLGNIGENYDKTFSVGNSEKQLRLHIKTGVSALDSAGYLKHNPQIQITLSVAKRDYVLLNTSQDFRKISAREFYSSIHE